MFFFFYQLQIPAKLCECGAIRIGGVNLAIEISFHIRFLSYLSRSMGQVGWYIHLYITPVVPYKHESLVCSDRSTNITRRHSVVSLLFPFSFSEVSGKIFLVQE